MRMVREGLATWVGSTILNIEVSRNPDPDRRRDAEALLTFANESSFRIAPKPIVPGTSRDSALARSTHCIWPAPNREAQTYCLQLMTVCCIAPGEASGCFTSGSI